MSIPTPGVPPMSPKVRAFLYGLLAWLAFGSAITFVVLAAIPSVGVPTWLAAASAGINAAWTFLGFLAKSNTPAP